MAINDIAIITHILTIAEVEADELLALSVLEDVNANDDIIEGVGVVGSKFGGTQKDHNSNDLLAIGIGIGVQ